MAKPPAPPPSPEGGSPDEPYPPPPPITLSGNVVPAPGMELDGAIYVAVVWNEYFPHPPAWDLTKCGSPGIAYDVSRHVVPGQQVRISAFGAYELTLSERPPSVARGLILLAPGEMATGYVVVYRDGNDNGVLDSASPSEPSPDSVLGVSRHWSGIGAIEPDTISHTVYFQDSDVPGYGPERARGFTVYRIETDALAQESSSGRVAPDSVDILLDAEDMHSTTLACSAICLVPSSHDCPTEIPDLPAHGQRLCFPATAEAYASFRWEATVCTGCSCKTDGCQWVLDPALPPPLGWPCDPPDGGP